MVAISAVQESQDIQQRAQFDPYAPTPTSIVVAPTSPPTTGCIPGSSTCTNGIMSVCTNSGGTYSSYNCPSGCNGNSCATVVVPTATIIKSGSGGTSGSCTPGSTSCVSGIQYVCTNSGGTYSSYNCPNGCNGNSCAPAVVPTSKAKPTATKSPLPSKTPVPTSTSVPTKTPRPTNTPLPTIAIVTSTVAPTLVPSSEVLVGPSGGTCYCKMNGSNVACGNQSLCCGNSNFANVDAVKDRGTCGTPPNVVRTAGVVQTNTKYENYGCGPSTLANILIDNGVTTLPNGKPVTLDNVIELYYPNFTTVTGINQNLEAAKSVQPKSFVLYDSTTTASPALNNQQVQKLMKEQLAHGDKLFVGSTVNGVPHWYEVTSIDENGNMYGTDSFFDPDGTKNNSEQPSVVNYTALNVQTSQSQIIVVPEL